MPLESLACTNCGSADVKAVKASTYFCNQCDSVFKHVDPAKVTTAPAFCSCGNPVTAQCQVCQVSVMCMACDATKNPDWRYIFIPTVGFGYLLPACYSWKELTGGQIRLRKMMEPMTIGPTLSAAKLLPHLFGAPSDLQHICWSCVAAAVPDAVRQIVAKSVCEEPFCTNRVELTCRRCRSARCSLHGILAPRRVATNSTDDDRPMCSGCLSSETDSGIAYSIFDDRTNTPAAAAPGVIGSP
jgi:hypothetical protein